MSSFKKKLSVKYVFEGIKTFCRICPNLERLDFGHKNFVDIQEHDKCASFSRSFESILYEISVGKVERLCK